MNTDKHRFKPAFDFSCGESSVLLYQGQAEMRIKGNTYAGDGEVRLDLLPRAGINLYGYFSCVSPMDTLVTSIGQKEISSFSIDGRQIKGFLKSSGSNVTDQKYNIKWCPGSEPVVGVGDDSTQMSRVVFHLFNFVEFFGTRRSKEKNGKTIHGIWHLDLTCNEWEV